MIAGWISTFFHDDKVKIALILVILDLIFGVIAAIHKGTFRLSYLMDFLRNDILFKLIPYYAFYVAALVAGGVDIVIPNFDLGFIAGSIYVGIVAAWTASILNSLLELRLPGGKQTLATIIGDENAAPPKD